MATPIRTADSGTASVPRRFGKVLIRTPKYLVLAGNLARDDRLSQAQRASAWVCLGYVISPIDLVPGFIPVAGQVDDLAVLIGGLRLLLRTCPRDVAIEQMARAGITTAIMDEDLRTVGATAAWIVQKVGAVASRGIAALARRALNGQTRAVQNLLPSPLRRRLPGRASRAKRE